MMQVVSSVFSHQKVFAMKAMKRLLIVSLVFVCAVQVAAAGEMPRAEPEEVGLESAKLQEACKTMQTIIDKKEMAGAIIAVARHGKVVLLHALGEMEAGSGKPMKTDTIVRIYSMTKPITTVAAMILVDGG